MKKTIGTTFALLFFAASGVSPDTVTAQPTPASPESSYNPCVIVTNDYARTRLGSLCLFRGSWVCHDLVTPIPGCVWTPVASDAISD